MMMMIIRLLSCKASIICIFASEIYNFWELPSVMRDDWGPCLFCMRPGPARPAIRKNSALESKAAQLLIMIITLQELCSLSKSQKSLHLELEPTPLRFASRRLRGQHDDDLLLSHDLSAPRFMVILLLRLLLRSNWSTSLLFWRQISKTNSRSRPTLNERTSESQFQDGRHEVFV